MSANDGVCGLILAGGQGRRMGGVDKGLQRLRGRPMVEWVIDRLSPQVNELTINANQNLDVYARYGHPVMRDEVREPGGAGPLAGLHSGLGSTTLPLLVCVPCDSPFLPLDLVARLCRDLEAHNAQIAVARTGQQSHPVFAVMRREVREHLGGFLAKGGRKIDAWYATLNVVEVAFDDQAQAFSNINTTDELRGHEAAR
ncbi:MAG: molybdenum cofactor guanylyltransferase [Betaproteobacteria bacterium]|nr:molybdenum cofactor guanylyltransferase [Betaproteobacteria bacterium]